MKGMGITVLYLCLLFGLRGAVEILNDHATQYILIIIFYYWDSWGLFSVCAGCSGELRDGRRRI